REGQAPSARGPARKGGAPERALPRTNSRRFQARVTSNRAASPADSDPTDARPSRARSSPAGARSRGSAAGHRRSPVDSWSEYKGCSRAHTSILLVGIVHQVHVLIHEEILRNDELRGAAVR